MTFEEANEIMRRRYSLDMTETVTDEESEEADKAFGIGAEDTFGIKYGDLTHICKKRDRCHYKSMFCICNFFEEESCQSKKS